MSRTTIAAVVLATIAGPLAGTAWSQAAPRTLELSFTPDRRVTLAAHNVTIAEILAEWARQCGCYLVNANRLTGAPLAVPLQFERAAQADVLASLLRQAAGYVLTPRRSGVGASDYETIYVIATGASTPAPASAFVSSPTSPAVPLVTVGSVDDGIPPVRPEVQPAQPVTPAPPAPTSRPASAGVYVPMTTVAPVAASPAPAPSAPAPGRVGAPSPGR